MPRQFVLSDFSGVIFDWDGVLVDSGKNYYRAYELVLREVGIATTSREIYLREGQPTPQVISALCAEHGVSITESRVKELVERRRQYDAAQGPRQFFARVWMWIDQLRTLKCKVGVVTGSSRKSVQLLLTPELEKRLDAVITADDVTLGKPDPQPFLLAAERMNVRTADCVVIENAPFGIQSARAAGCGIVAICTTLPANDLRGADWIVQDHTQLESLFALAKNTSI